MKERGEEREGSTKEEFCMSDYLERRRPFVTSRTLLPRRIIRHLGAPLSVDCVEIFVAISWAEDDRGRGGGEKREVIFTVSEVQNSRAHRKR